MPRPKATNRFKNYASTVENFLGFYTYLYQAFSKFSEAQAMKKQILSSVLSCYIQNPDVKGGV